MKNDTAAGLRALMPDWQSRVERALDHWLPGATLHPTRLHEAMRYTVLGGGKRVRPILVYATGTALGISMDALDGLACAMELIHAYSLIHDDLPAMDNDDLRRGKPTCHRAFDEATAILAGDALHTLAFYILSHDPALQAPAEARLAMIETLALAAGSRGMVGGQAIDLAAVGCTLDIAELEDMHIHKTGALIRAAVRLAALAAPELNHDTLHRLDHYAKCVGLAFQIRDDILDIEGDVATLGKRQGADLALNKPTYPALLGLDESKNRAHQLHEEALASLATLDEQAEALRGLSHYIVDRSH
jgi:geranylgeranyl pyrophosphate synthase